MTGFLIVVGSRGLTPRAPRAQGELGETEDWLGDFAIALALLGVLIWGLLGGKVGVIFMLRQRQGGRSYAPDSYSVDFRGVADRGGCNPCCRRRGFGQRVSEGRLRLLVEPLTTD